MQINQKNILTFLLLACLFYTYVGLSAVGEWKTFTSSGDVRDMVVGDSTIWCATNGGVHRFSIASSIFDQFTNTEGLTSNDAVAIEMDAKGRVWVGLSDGRLNSYDPETATWTGRFLDENDPSLRILDIKAVGDSLLVALNVGIALYETGPGHVKETYKQLGWGRPHFVPVNQILVVDSQIWAATNSGVATASFESSNLQAPNSWVNYTISDGLPSNTIHALTWFDSVVVAGTDAGVSFKQIDWGNNELVDKTVYALTEYSGELVAATSSGVYIRDAETNWQRLGPWMDNISSIGVDGNGGLWLSKQDDGLMRWDTTQDQWIQFVPDGPGSNRFADVALDPSGTLWCASGDGLFRFDGESWQNFTTANAPFRQNIFTDVVIDTHERVWASSWGGGIVVIDDLGDSLNFDIIDQEDGLSGAEGSPTYVVVNKMKVDAEGNVWILNDVADSHNPLAVYGFDDRWQFFSTSDGIRSTRVSAVEVDHSGRVWVGTEGSGIVVVDHKNTIYDKTDDDLSGGLTISEGLESSQIRTIAEDRDGVIWIGTPEGLNYWFQGEVNTWYGLISDDINVIAVDARNNKWIGTSGGVSVLAADGYSWTHYTTDNSQLVSDNIQGFAFNEDTGTVYIATTNGLSKLETPFSAPKPDLNLVRGYPNPFVVGENRSRFYVENLADQSSLRIFTLDGAMVRHIPDSQIFGSRTEWDGRNDKGDLVASGIYYFVVSTEEGMSTVGKVAVIRR